MERSSAEAEYKAMTSATCELIWLKHLLKELQFEEVTQMTLICDNRLLFILAQILYFMKGPIILRLIAISIERKLYLETSRLNLLIRMIS